MPRNMKEKAILFGPFVGELYWEFARFAPLLSYYRFDKYKNQNIKYIVLTRQDRFDIYGNVADILVPLRIEGDYINKHPNCFRLEMFFESDYQNIADKFKRKYEERYEIIEHIYPSISKSEFCNKEQFIRTRNHKGLCSVYKSNPREDNYRLVDEYLPKNGKSLVIIAPRYREGFKRNWNEWLTLYDLIENYKYFNSRYNIILCGKKGEYIPDPKERFYDMNKIELTNNSSSFGILIAIIQRALFTFGSQSAIPNISLIYGVETLQFGCQKELHTKTYNYSNTPVTFISDSSYCIKPKKIFNLFTKLVSIKEKKERKNEQNDQSYFDVTIED